MPTAPAAVPLETVWSAFNAFPDPVVVANHDGIIVHCNPSAAKLLGWPADELRGLSLTSIMPDRMRHAHTHGLARYVATGAARVMGKPVRVPALHRDGSELDIELNISPMQGPGGSELFVACLRDLRERAELESQVHEQRRLLAYYSVVTALTHSDTLEQVARRLIDAVCSSLHWDVGIFWRVNPEYQRLESFYISSARAEALRPFIDASHKLTFTRSDGWPGRVWDTKQPAWRQNIQDDPLYLRAGVAKACGLKEAVLLPMLYKDEVIGVLEFNNANITNPDDTLLTTITTAALQVGLFLERLRTETGLRENRESQQRRAHFLADVSALLTRSLEYDKSLRSVLRRTVPEFGDWIAICLSQHDAQGAVPESASEGSGPTAGPVGTTYALRPLAIAHTHAQHDAAVQAHVSALCKQPTSPPSRCVASGRPNLHTQEDLGEQSAPPEVLPRSALVAPLSARGQIIGCCYLGSVTPGRYRPADLELLRELADHIAYAIDNGRLYHEAKKAVTARDTFLSIASHELKTPLTALLLQVQTAQRQLERSPEQSLPKIPKKFEFMVLQVRRLNDLVTRLLDISRIAVSRVEVNYSPTDLAEVIRSIVTLYSGEQGTTNHPPLLYEGPAHLVGQWDTGRIEQVLTNLVSNAIKFGEGKPVIIGLEESDGWAHIRVQDQGLGIPEKDQARIFERFERAVSKRHFGGFGLGLWICRQFVQAHGGRISVKSQPRMGSAFFVDLPVHPASAPAPN